MAAGVTLGGTLAADEPRLRERIQERARWRAVHLACHGLLNPDEPTLTALALSPTPQDDGLLTVLDVFRMQVPADLVVLSACETAKGKAYRGEGIVGMVRAFMFAGAPRVLVSLWKVDDRSTRLLMEAFYDAWLEKGRSPAAALRDAQQRVRDHEDRQIDPAASRLAGKDVFVAAKPYASPRYWAAWSLWGLPD